jgi:DNA-binding transcriptional MerR regulator
MKERFRIEPGNMAIRTALTNRVFHANVVTDFRELKMSAKANLSSKNAKKKDKLVYKLDEISRLSQLDPKVIESWEKEFYFLNAGETGTGVKIFRKKDLSIILRIKELLEKEGLTLAGAKRKIEDEFGAKKSSQVHPDRLKKTLFRVREQLREIISTMEK